MGYGISGTASHDFTLYVMDISTYEVLRSGDISAGAYVFYVGESSNTVDVIGRTTNAAQNIVSYKDIILNSEIDPDLQALVMGGYDGSVVDSVRTFFTVWTSKTAMPESIKDGGASTMSGKTHYVYGYTTGYSKDHKVYDNDSWSSATNPPDVTKSRVCSHTINNEYYVGGGKTTDGHNGAAGTFRGAYEKWTSGESWVSYGMPPRDGNTAVLTVGTAGDGSKAWLVGGRSYNGSKNNEVNRDDGSATYTVLAPAWRDQAWATVVYIDGNIYNMGYEVHEYPGGNYTEYFGKYHDIYSISGDSWSAATQMPAPIRVAYESGFALEGKSHIVGSGVDHDVYTPGANTWAADINMPESLSGHRTAMI